MAATKKIRVDRTYSTDNATDATARNLISVNTGAPGFNALTGVISIPNNTSQLTNGAGFLVASDISGKQNTLVSGTNIKTVNGNSLLGSGDLTISSGGTSLPAQTGNSGKYLTTDGSNLSWATVSGGGGASLGNLSVTGSTITASSTNTYTSSDWSAAYWWSTATIYIIGAHTVLASILAKLEAYTSSIKINGATYTVQSTQWNGSSGFINTTSLIPNTSITSIEVTDLGVHITNLVVGSLSGGPSGQPVKLFGTQIAIGDSAGNTQNSGAIAIGQSAGNQSQGYNAIAIGTNAGSGQQGNNAIAIGYNAGSSSQPGNSIVIQANPDANLTPTQSGFYVTPVRSDPAPSNIIYYNTTTKEMTYGPVPSGGSGSGGGGAGGLDNTAFSFSPQPGTYLNNGSSFIWTPPTHSGTTLALLNGPAWVNIVQAGQSMTQLMTTYGSVSPPWASFWYGTATGDQTAMLQSSGSGYPRWYCWTLDASTNPATQSSWSGNFPTQIDMNALTVNIMNPYSSMGWTPTSPGYFYGILFTDAISLTDFTPSAGVTYSLNLEMSQVFLKIPASVWAANGGTGGIIGTLVGPTPGSNISGGISGVAFGT